MARVFVVIGKSGTGKDTFFKVLLSKNKEFDADNIDLTGVIPYTSRPRRNKEYGVERIFWKPETVDFDPPAYVFKDAEFFSKENEDKFIEHRTYRVANNDIWHYATPKFKPEGDTDYILIATPEAVPKIQDVMEEYNTPVIVIMTTCNPRVRINRMLDRNGGTPTAFQIKEQCRRFISDEEDFSDQNLSRINRLIYIPSTISRREMVDIFLNIYNER